MSKISHYAGQRTPTISKTLLAAIEGAGAYRFGPIETDKERSDRMRRGDPAPGLVIAAGVRTQPSKEEIAEAKRVLPELELAMQPMPSDLLQAEVSRFLDMLNAAVANPQDEKALGLRKIATSLACEGLPAIVWTPEALKLAIRQFKFFPSSAEFAEFMEGQIEQKRSRMAAIRTISRRMPKEQTPDRHKPTEEERAAVSAKLESLRAEQALREAREDAEREFGMWVPEGSENASDGALIESLRGVVNTLDGWHKIIVQERIEMLERREVLLASLNGSSV